MAIESKRQTVESNTCAGSVLFSAAVYHVNLNAASVQGYDIAQLSSKRFEANH